MPFKVRLVAYITGAVGFPTDDDDVIPSTSELVVVEVTSKLEIFRDTLGEFMVACRVAPSATVKVPPPEHMDLTPSSPLLITVGPV